MLGPAFIPSVGLDMPWVPQPAPALHHSSYATPHQYIARYGKAEAVQLLSDEDRLLTDALLEQALQRYDGGVWTDTTVSTDQQQAATRALDRLTRQLGTASRFMDGYLRSAVTLPIAAGDANASTLEDCCLALTRCGLADDSDNATDRIDKCCETWRQWLRDVAAGRIKLVTPTGVEVPTSARRVLSGQVRSGFDWGRFGA